MDDVNEIYNPLRFKGKNVLIVDSDDISRMVMKHVLSSQDFLVSEEADGVSALDRIQKEKHDLVIVELRLPRMSGLDLIAKSREIRPNLPIIIVTGEGNLDQAIEAIRFNVFFYFKKPIVNLDEFFRILDNALEREELIQQNQLYQVELSRLNAQLQHSVEEKTAAITFLKERLETMFRMVPRVLSAPNIEGKLKFAKEALTGPSFFHDCTLYLEDKERGILATYSGDAALEESVLTKRYELLRGAFDEQRGSGLYEINNGQEDHLTSVVLVPFRNQEGSIVGLAELQHNEQPIPEMNETLKLMELFFSQAILSIDQFKLERELEKSEASYRSLIDNVSDVIFRLDREFKFTFVSRQVYDLLGLQWKAVLGSVFLKYIRPDDMDWVSKGLHEILEGRRITQDLVILTPSGREVIAFVAANPIIEEGGKITGILGVARDVTEKRRLEQQIQESERRYRALTENAYDAILIVDPNSLVIIDANPQAEKLTGYSKEELLHMTALDLRRKEHADVVREFVAKVMSTGSGRFDDAPIRTKDGSEIQVGTAASVLLLEGKRYYQAIVRDISIQKQVTAALNQRVMELQILSEVSDALQSSVDLPSVMGIVLAGVTAGKGLGFNRAFILSYDKERNELRGEAGVGPQSAEDAGRIWSDLDSRGLTLSEILEAKIRTFPLEIDAAVAVARDLTIRLDDEQNVFARAILHRETIRVDRTVEDPHLPGDFLNRYHADHFAVVPLVTRDDVMGVILVDNLFSRQAIHDEDLHRLKLYANSAASAIERSRLLISLEKRLHELTHANQDLKESRNRLVKTERLSAVGEVAASVAHEIRNPLTAIGGFARNVLNSLEEKDKNRRKLQVIVEETNRLENILSSLLEFSRPSVPRFTEIDLNSLILQTIHFMDAEIDHSLIRLQFELQASLPMAWADGDQIRQVLLNILRNAIHAMTAGGKGGMISVKTDFDQSFIHIDIQDNGPGIPSDILDKIFDAFFTTKSTGSGLGLAICSQILRNHNGRIEAFSPPGQGARFVITLPTPEKSP